MDLSLAKSKLSEKFTFKQHSIFDSIEQSHTSNPHDKG